MLKKYQWKISETRYVIYHGSAWDFLVDNGWVTVRVDEISSGIKMALMIYSPER